MIINTTFLSKIIRTTCFFTKHIKQQSFPCALKLSTCQLKILAYIWRLGRSEYRTLHRRTWKKKKENKDGAKRQRWCHTASLPYLEAVIGPTTEFQNAGLLVKGEIFYVYFTRRLVNGWRFPLHQSLMVDRSLRRQGNLEVAVSAVGGEKQQHTDWGQTIEFRFWGTSLGSLNMIDGNRRHTSMRRTNY